MGIESRLEREKFPEEARRSRQAEQRKQEKREADGKDGLLLPEPGVIANRKVLFALLAEMREDQERADLHQHVRREIKQHSRNAEPLDAANATRM